MQLARLTKLPFDVDLAVLMRKGDVSLSIDQGIHPSYELQRPVQSSVALDVEGIKPQVISNLRAMKPVIKVITSDERDEASRLHFESLAEDTRE